MGSLESPLQAEAFEGGKIAMAGLVLSRDMRRLGPQAAGALVEDRVPLIARGVLIIPSGSTRFKASESMGIYTEVYDQGLVGAEPPDVGVTFQVKDRKSGAQKLDSGLVQVSGPGTNQGAKVPVGLTLPLAKLGPGAYTLEITAEDSFGARAGKRSVDFDVE